MRDRNEFITDFQVVDCNEKGASFYNMSKDKFTGVKVSDFYSGEYFDKVMQAYRIAMETGFFEDDYQVPPDSPVDAEWLKRKFVRSENGLAITLRDISEPKRHEREMSRLATEDGLTALPNRHWFMNYLPKALENAKANATMLAILFIDLDDFKNVNDTLGHSAGDQLLCTVAKRLRSVLRPSDKVIRIGGDEFTVILEAIHSEEEAAHIAYAINQALREPFDISRDTSSQKNRIGGSIGISIFPRDGHDVETLVKNADIAMYAAKTGSKGQFRFYDHTLYEDIKMRLNTEQELQQAIREDQFLIYYQPRVQTQTGKLLGIEALIRWQHPTRGLVLPNDFIGLAEETDLIHPIGELVVDKVCAQLASWLKQGVEAVPVSVNVSPHQFNEGKVKKSLAASLAKHGIPASLLEIELTESAMMRNIGDIFDELTAINEMGIKVHVDDFGTGYSSLSLLQRLDMDILKIDQAFTSQLGRGKDGEIFFTAIVSMAKALGMRVVAEGVETLEQLRILQTLSCDEVQGYYVAWPLPADNIADIIRKQNLFP
jgi:diguanylate cyclase (GGDEF)-like protein